MKIHPLIPLLVVAVALPACGKKPSPHSGTYLYQGRDTTMGEEITQAEIRLNPDGTASALVRSHGHIEAIGTTTIDVTLSGKGTWKDVGEKAEAVIVIDKWVNKGKELVPSEPFRITLSGGAFPSVSASSIKPKDGPSFVPSFTPIFGLWTHEPAP